MSLRSSPSIDTLTTYPSTAPSLRNSALGLVNDLEESRNRRAQSRRSTSSYNQHSVTPQLPDKPSPSATNRHRAPNTLAVPMAGMPKKKTSTRSLTRHEAVQKSSETERILVKGLQQVTIGQSAGPERHWETSAIWQNEQADPAREAEDRVRRDAAYPPACPRQPIRMSASGVTSVHIGIRPRLHPSWAAESVERNQPVDGAELPYNDPSNVIGAKAQAEYEAWLSRKTEREGVVGQEGQAAGTRDWEPRSRSIARPASTVTSPEAVTPSLQDWADPTANHHGDASPSMYVPQDGAEYPYYGWWPGLDWSEVTQWVQPLAFDSHLDRPDNVDPNTYPISPAAMFNPYMAAMPQGYPPMGFYNPAWQGQPPAMMVAGEEVGQLPLEGELKQFDSSQMKRGRMGHYGYLEGRELAGPPVGYLPAGMPPLPRQPSQSQQTQQLQRSAPSTQAAGSQAWGDPQLMLRARYDGTSGAKQYVQADLDTPYPRTDAGGVTSAWTKFGADQKVINGIDGRMGINHRRQREGKV